MDVRKDTKAANKSAAKPPRATTRLRFPLSPKAQTLPRALAREFQKSLNPKALRELTAFCKTRGFHRNEVLQALVMFTAVNDVDSHGRN